jgi:hypothetical protein
VKILLATFALVFLRALQQQNVVHGHYALAFGTSYAMALADVAVVLWIVHTGWSAVPWAGTGGALGVTAAMFLHRRVFPRRRQA